MTHLPKRLLCLCLCLILVGTLIPQSPLSVQAADASALPQLHYGNYETLAMIYNQGDCFSMQGMTLDRTYTYCAKVNTDTDASACIIRTNKSTGDKTVMINSATGGYYFYNLGHANALDTTWIGGCGQLLVTTGPKLVRLTMSGSYLTTAGTYTATYNGASQSMTAVQIIAASEERVDVLVKTGRTLFTGSLDPTVSSGNIELSKLCTINISSARLKGEIYDFSSYLQQGFDYYDGKIFLPLSGNSQADTSVVLVYDLEGASGELKNDPTLSFRIISGKYAALFEIEDVAICQETGRLYFSTNRRLSSSDTNYDSCSYFLDYSYNPAMSTTSPANYRWETVNNELISVTDGGNTLSTPIRFHGSISNDQMTHGLFSLSRSVMLLHNEPWVVEWKASGAFSGGAMLLAAGQHSMVSNKPYLYRQQAGMVALGYYDGSSYHNYGIKTQDHGIDPTAEHTYRMTNKVAADGSNMIYLSVDGTELGAMNQHHIGGTLQETDNSWINGRDFTFSYIGCYHYPLTTCKLNYLQVWAKGEPAKADNTYRWGGDMLTSSGSAANKATVYTGSVSGTAYSSAAFRLDQAVVLRHDHRWSVEWQSEGAFSGGTFLLSSAEGGATRNAPFLFRYKNGLLALGYFDGTQHCNYGLMLTDHGIDYSAQHTYRLTNRIASDGSNMVWLYVDDQEVAPMNQVYHGTASQGTTSDWISGKDFVFDYVGNIAYPMNGSYEYLQVWEEGVGYNIEFKDYNGCTIATKQYGFGEIPVPPADPVREMDHRYIYTFSHWEPELAPASEDTCYLAVYDTAPRYYTVTFKNDDGTVLSTQQLTYGETPTAPADPTKPTEGSTAYTFAGWDQTVTTVKGDATYTATYTAGPASVTVIFKNDDGTVISTQTLAYGDTPVTPAAPSKAATVSHSYTFVGWDAAIVAATKDTVYTARYASSLRKYNVVYKNYDGTVLSTQLVPYGYYATNPSDPARNPDASGHYTFNGWNPAPGSVSGNTTYTATFTTGAHTGSAVTVQPTCTVVGSVTRTCTVCGYTARQTIPATGHSYQSSVTAPTCTAQGYTTYTCSCGSSYTANAVAALGHSYSGGSCTRCGAEDPNYVPPVTQPTLKLSHPSLTFEDVITMNVYYSATNIQDVVEMGLITYSSQVTSFNVNNAEAVIPGYQYNTNGFYSVATNGIAAKDMGDTIWFAVYAKLSDGSYVYTKLVSYSPKTYAYSMLTKGTEATKKLCVALLNYGAAAQTYFGYKTDSLMNAGLTAAQKASIESYRSDMMVASVAPGAAKAANFVNNGGYTRRYPSIVFEGAFAISYNYIPAYTPRGNITMYVWDQATFDSVSVLTKANATKVIAMTPGSTYVGVVDGIAAKDLDKGVYVSFCYSDGTTNYCSGILAYSIGDYCTGKAAGTTTMAPFAAATAVYGYYAKLMFYYTDNG